MQIQEKLFKSNTDILRSARIMPWFTAGIKIHSITHALFSKVMPERMAFAFNKFWQFGISFTLC